MIGHLTYSRTDAGTRRHGDAGKGSPDAFASGFTASLRHRLAVSVAETLRTRA